MEIQGNKYDSCLADLTMALRELAEHTTDMSVANSAYRFVRMLEQANPENAEDIVQTIRHEFSSPKTDFTDSMDRSEFMSRAADAAHAAKSYYFSLRRPDLIAIAKDRK